MKRFIAGVAVFAFMTGMAFAAEDGAATYKAKCAACHGSTGEGKMGPKLVGTSLSADQIATELTKGAEGKKAPHGKPAAGLTADQASAVAAYVKTLK
jgi:mono/diheme cytochrome c family protein